MKHHPDPGWPRLSKAGKTWPASYLEEGKKKNEAIGLTGPRFDGPCMLMGDLDLDEIPRGKYDLDVVGHYSRPDIFRLYVNTDPTPSVVVSSGGITDPFKK